MVKLYRPTTDYQCHQLDSAGSSKSYKGITTQEDNTLVDQRRSVVVCLNIRTNLPKQTVHISGQDKVFFSTEKY